MKGRYLFMSTTINPGTGFAAVRAEYEMQKPQVAIDKAPQTNKPTDKFEHAYPDPNEHKLQDMLCKLRIGAAVTAGIGTTIAAGATVGAGVHALLGIGTITTAAVAGAMIVPTIACAGLAKLSEALAPHY